VVNQQSGVVTTLIEPRGLHLGVDVEKTHGDCVELAGRWRRDALARR
jgi:hypothetical protein